MQACGPVVRPHEILQTLIISIPQPSAAVKSFFELSRNFGAPEAMSALLLYHQQTADLSPIQRLAAGGEIYARSERGQWPPSAAGGVGAHRQGQKGTGHHMVSCPLLTPLTFLWTRLPSVARLKARGPQMRLVLQEYTFDRSKAFRSANQAPCTVWPRTVMRGGSRKVNSGQQCVPKAARRTEPSPRNPRFAAHLRCVSAKEGLGESRGGKGTIRCPCPLLPLAVGTASPLRIKKLPHIHRNM